jgi:hypothetical protein
MAQSGGAINQPQPIERTKQNGAVEQVSTSGQPQVSTSPNEQTTRDTGRGRWRTTDAQPQNADAQRSAAPQQEQGQRRRGGIQDVFSQPRQNAGQASEQPTRQRSYEQPRQARSYEQPQQQRSYEQPQRSEPSYSAPSYGGGNSGGGNSGGGGGGGRRARD